MRDHSFEHAGLIVICTTMGLILPQLPPRVLTTGIDVTAAAAGRRSSRGMTMSSWRLVGLLAYYVLLSALAAVFAAAFATAPYWIWPA